MNDQALDSIKWKNKYCVSIMDSCLVEIVQVEGVQMSESPAPPTDQQRSPDIEMHRKLNMYLIKFERPRKIAAPSA